MPHRTPTCPARRLQPPSARLVTLLWAFIAATAFSGCRPEVHSYEGDPRPPGDLAGIRTNTIDAQADLAIEAVDARRVHVTHAELMLLPGPHTLRVRVATTPAIDFNRLATDDPAAGSLSPADQRKTYWFDLPVVVEPGRRYTLNGAATNRNASAWVIDDLTGQRIAEVETTPKR